MRIERITASGRDRYTVALESGAALEITDRELLRFGLRAGDVLDEQIWEQLRESASLSHVKGKAADLIGRRAMSRATLEKKLREKGASEAETRYAAEWLEAIGAINDAEYAALLVRHCADRGYGPARVREKLYEKGIPRELWEEALETMPDPAEQIDRFLQEKLRGRIPDEKEKKRLSDALLRRGFGWGDVKAGLNRLGAELYEE